MNKSEDLSPQTIGLSPQDMKRLLDEKHRRETGTGRSLSMSKLIRELVRERLSQ